MARYLYTGHLGIGLPRGNKGLFLQLGTKRNFPWKQDFAEWDSSPFPSPPKIFFAFGTVILLWNLRFWVRYRGGFTPSLYKNSPPCSGEIPPVKAPRRVMSRMLMKVCSFGESRRTVPGRMSHLLKCVNSTLNFYWWIFFPIPLVVPYCTCRVLLL